MNSAFLKLTQLASAAGFCLALAACGGGDDTPAAGGGGAGGAPGTVSGPIASIVGDYPVAVTKFDCSAGNQSPLTKLEPQANGSCKVTSLPAAAGLATLVELQRDILPEGRYTLRIASDGSMEMLQGTVSKAKVTCPSGGLCTVLGVGGLTNYSLAGGSAAGVGLSTVIITGTGTAKSVLSGSVYGLGNLSFTGTSPLANGESGILFFAAPGG